MNELLRIIQKELKSHIEPAYKDQAQRFSKEKITLIGVRKPVVRKMAAHYFKLIKHEDKKTILVLCEEFLKGDIHELQTIAFDWALRIKKSYELSDFTIFESWLTRYVSNWASCDDFCHVLEIFVFNYPSLVPRIKEWTQSSNRWVRRSSAVCLIYSLKKGKHLVDAFVIVDSLLADRDDLVQKGYGWMLKEASEVHQQEVFEYVEKHKRVMPRTALRYAIEKMPVALKKQAMSLS